LKESEEYVMNKMIGILEGLKIVDEAKARVLPADLADMIPDLKVSAKDIVRCKQLMDSVIKKLETGNIKSDPKNLKVWLGELDKYVFQLSDALQDTDNEM
jgi:hypothetical protein